MSSLRDHVYGTCKVSVFGKNMKTNKEDNEEECKERFTIDYHPYVTLLFIKSCCRCSLLIACVCFRKDIFYSTSALKVLNLCRLFIQSGLILAFLISRLKNEMTNYNKDKFSGCYKKNLDSFEKSTVLVQNE